jgi:uncharacterized protein YcfJ
MNKIVFHNGNNRCLNSNIRKIVFTMATIVALTATVAMAGTEKVPVVSKQPIYSNQTVKTGTVTQCREVFVQQPQGGVFDGTGEALKGNGDALIGSIIGGVIGNQFGGGNGKTAMTVLGVIVGGNMANGTSKKGETIRQTVCDEVPQYSTKTTIVGWNVSYQYDGQIYHVQMTQDPGQYVTLKTSTTHKVVN